MTSRDKAREELESYRKALREALRLAMRAKLLRERALHSAQKLDPAKVDMSVRGKGPEELIIKAADLEMASERIKKEAEQTRLYLERRIDSLENPYFAQILKDYWLSGLQLKDIAGINFYSEGTIKNIHLQALDAYACKFF